LIGIKWEKGGKVKHPVGYNEKFEEFVVKSLRLR
jgi:hypothetical protein